jgi:putative transposase
MDGSIRLSSRDRKTLLHVYRSGAGVRSRRAHVILLAADGWSVRDIRSGTFTSFDFICDTLRTYRDEGLEAVTDEPPTPPLPAWATIVANWLATKTPEDFGFFRRRWSCELVATVLAWEERVQVSTETVRRVMRRLGYVWRRPRPVVGPVDPDRDAKLLAIQALLRNLPADETAVFQDEVDIHLNPKIGSCWMKRGEQTEVVTPGNNEKRHVAGSLVWRTGTLVVSPPGTRRNADLFVAHLDDLRVRFRHVRKVHVICDNAAFHRCHKVQDYLRTWGHRVAIHFLPRYAPDTNPIERVWWQLHDKLTRNHRCPTMDDLLCDVYSWIERQKCFYNKELAQYATAA